MIDRYMHQSNLQEYTREEFREFVHILMTETGGSEAEDNRRVQQFDRVVPHPERNGLIFWPPEGIETAEDIVTEIERYCRENGLPALKDS